ncbi:MAG: CRISPR-associated helicase Cas3' [Methanosarcinales archaeon]|uniref:CRISPR-associated helicase Cas3 n=1 Tax=Candidatus Ethanoperedens thermophilum TaxID=2766897 RepID=A0A848D972_9EURY|nr:CRISPR-associated helicase Cas3' [Candidatus Ethanoperedens thermophilum]
MEVDQEKISYSSNDLKSHPDKLLKDHLSSVGTLCKEIVSSKKLNIGEYVNFEVLQDISYLVGITHDFGKGTSFFQKYINERDESKRIKLKNKPETHHGLLSSILTYYVIKEYLSRKNLHDKENYKYLPILSFLVVKRHHGNLHNALDETIGFGEKDKEVLEKQIKSIDFNKINSIYSTLFSNIHFNFDCNLVHDKVLKSEPLYIYGALKEHKNYYVQDICGEEKKLIRNIDEEHSLFYYFTTLFLYSILLDADKTDAANLKLIRRKNIPSDIVDTYKKSKFRGQNTKMNKMRNEIYEDVLKNVKNINLEKDKILSLNVPTGTGKTLTSLSFALKLRKLIEDEKGYQSRIIYSLPFLSIIDQNYDVFNDVLDSPSTDILLKHHHLSDTAYTTRENEFESTDNDIGKDLLLIEGWNSEIIVTTFIQFFYSLISKKNKAIRKVHNIVNSIVILDEVQAIPHKYWVLLNKTINFFAKHFNTYFIFITATQPLIFNEKNNEIKELVKNKEKYFRELDRVKLSVNLKPIIIESFKEILKKDLIENKNEDFLVVLNTINSSKDIYSFVNNLNINNSELYYLSTNIVPKDRLKIIKEIKEKNSKRKIVVSTQLIEAGVDIDVDIVYRDFAPLDSINQVAGRCNRNFGDRKGVVKIFVLKEEEGSKEYYKYIYGYFLPSKTETVLKNKNEISESEFLKLNESYFEKVAIGKNDDESNSILEKVEELKFDDLSEFKLIEKGYPEIDVFIELDNSAEEVWQKYQKIQKLPPLKRKKEFLKIKSQFYDYVISIPQRYKNQVGFDEKSGIGHISKYEIEQGIGYDRTIGFKRDESGGGTIIC